jgi:hypothetical protein
MSKPSTPDAYYASLDPPMADIARAVRDHVMARAPHLSVKLAWGFPCYAGNERVFSIIAHKAHVNLQLWSGARLAESSPRIEGTGKQLRHVKLATPDQLDAELDAILDAAVELDRMSPEKVR